MTASATSLLSGLNGQLPGLRALYKDLHAHPELSFQEVRTAGIVAARLREQGWDVTEGWAEPVSSASSPRATARWCCSVPTWTHCP